MKATNGSEAQYLLRKLVILEGGELAGGHPWLWEDDRWEELVFSLLHGVVSLPEEEVREMTAAMGNLGLLQVPSLAAMTKKSNDPDSYANGTRILEFLEESGVDGEEAKKALTTICEAAVGLQKHFSGKAQLYLRRAGEAMLRGLSETFRFSELSDAQVQSAFTYWLQNVLNMPLSLLDANVVEFCEKHNLTPEELTTAADELDLNLAFVDDLVQNYTARRAVDSELQGEPSPEPA
jgi:hypothetical protein